MLVIKACYYLRSAGLFQFPVSKLFSQLKYQKGFTLHYVPTAGQKHIFIIEVTLNLWIQNTFKIKEVPPTHPLYHTQRNFLFPHGQRGKKYPHRWFLECGWGKRENGINGQQLPAPWKIGIPTLTCAYSLLPCTHPTLEAGSFPVSMNECLFHSHFAGERKPAQQSRDTH